MSKIQLHSTVLIVLFGLTIAATYAKKPLTIAGRPQTDFARIPMEIDGWYGTELTWDEMTLNALPSASLLRRSYTHESDPYTVELAIVYGTDLGDFHQPEVCLTGQGWRTLHSFPVRIATRDGESFVANNVIMEHGQGFRNAFMYWFYSRGIVSTSLGSYKLRMLRDRILGTGVEPSAMIRLSTEVYGEDDKEATEHLRAFAEAAAPYIREEFSVEPDGR